MPGWFPAYLLATSLLMPAMQLFFGWIMSRYPGDVNGVFGYRTRRSSKNRNTWVFANRLAGKIWVRQGLVALPASLVACLIFWGVLEWASLFILGAQLVLLISVIPIVERQLGRRFDGRGWPVDPTETAAPEKDPWEN